MYSDFYEIPLPALRFEKVEESHTKVNDTAENNARPRQKQISKVRHYAENIEHEYYIIAKDVRFISVSRIKYIHIYKHIYVSILYI